MALTVMRRRGLTGLATPVVLGGGVLTARHPLLTGWITERLAAGAPAADVRVTDVPPIAGAALLGLDQTGARARATPRLPAAYLPEHCGERIRPWQATAAAATTFSESTPRAIAAELIGMHTAWSASCIQRDDSPSPSEPSSRATRWPSPASSRGTAD